MSQTHAATELQDLVESFNRSFSEWSKKHSCGANFGFKYSPESGEKQLTVMDLAPWDPSRPLTSDDPRAVAALEHLKQVIAQADAGSLVL